MSAIVGFYGKLPIVGDFVSRRLPNEFIAPWDVWLQSAINASRETLGNDWLNCYLTSPIWRFLLSEGVCGDKAVAGIIMPSVDRVGRYFPLTVAVVFEQTLPLPYLFTAGNVWFEQLEDAALTGLEGNLDINAFDQLIQSIPVFSLPTSSAIRQHPGNEKKAFYTAIESAEHIVDAFVGLNAQLLPRFMPGYSLWVNEGAENVQSALIACEGLPAIGSFAGFLNSGRLSDSKQINTPSVDPTFIVAKKETTVPEQPTLSSILAADNSVLTNPCWNSWAITHTGKRRKHNEDSILSRPEVGLWIVADGMGGHKAGDVASQLIVSTLKDLVPPESLERYIEEVEECLQSVNFQLRQLANKVYGNQLVGSTVVALIADSERCAFLWAGDSRLYRLRNNFLQQLTQDHCVDNEQNASAYSVKNSNVITRAVGADDILDIDVKITEVQDGDVFLLSSDGLDKEMSLNEIEHIMNCSFYADIANALINETLARGARDNVSVIVVTANSL